MDVIDRNIFAGIQKSIKSFPVVGILGPRQCGKTTLVKKLLIEDPQKYLYLDLEHPRDLAKLHDPVLYFENNKEKCVVMDEIQRKPDLFPIMRSLIDEKRVPGRFIILGSAAPELIRDSSETLAGRISYKELTPFHYLEIDQFAGLETHWQRGGFPDAFSQDDDEIRTEWYYNFVKTYVEYELPALGLGLQPSTLNRVWKMLASSHGNVLNKSNFSKSMEISFPTLSKYLNYLEQAFLIHQLPPFSSNMKKRLVKSPKIYIRDSGILHYHLNINNFDQLAGNMMLGVSWEGYIIEQIKTVLPLGMEMYFYRTQQGTEIDIVLCESGIPKYGIEIKYTSTPSITKSLAIAIEDMKTETNFIVVPNTDPFQLRKDLTVCDLKFLLSRIR